MTITCIFLMGNLRLEGVKWFSVKEQSWDSDILSDPSAHTLVFNLRKAGEQHPAAGIAHLSV